MRAFSMASICDPPFDHGSTTTHRVMVHEYLKWVNCTIKEASHKTLEPKQVPDLRGVSWWNNACSVAHMLAQTTAAGPERRQAAKNL
jgi:hypothetical protein